MSWNFFLGGGTKSWDIQSSSGYLPDKILKLYRFRPQRGNILWPEFPRMSFGYKLRTPSIPGGAIAISYGAAPWIIEWVSGLYSEDILRNPVAFKSILTHMPLN